MKILLADDVLYKYCINCGNESDKNAKQCEVCGKKDSLMEITEQQAKEICEQIKEHNDNFIKEIF